MPTERLQSANVPTSVPIGNSNGLEVEGNITPPLLPTKSADDSKNARAVNWCFTYHGINQLNRILLDDVIKNWSTDGTPENNFIKYAFYSIEQGKRNGTIHAQGLLVMKKQTYWSVINNAFNQMIGFKGVFNVMKGTLKQNEDYCSKDDTHLEGPFVFGERPKNSRGKRTDLEDIKEMIKEEGLSKEVKESNEFRKYPNWCKELNSMYRKDRLRKDIKEEFKNAVLTDIQKIWEKLILTQNDRQLLWIYDPYGNSGKSWFARYMYAKHKAYIAQNGTTRDLMEAYNDEDIVIIDLTRSEEEKINYSIIEKWKNGVIFKSKYYSNTEIRKPIKLCIMANFEPDNEKLSLDRWVKVCLIGNTWKVFKPIEKNRIEPKIDDSLRELSESL